MDAGDKFVDMYVKRLYEIFSSTFSKLSSEDLAVFNGNILSLKELLSKLEEE